MNTLIELQDWYAMQCNGEWEHDYGVRIDTLDNPGWRIEVDLTGTQLADTPFKCTANETSEHDWYDCTVENCQFVGHGGPKSLSSMIEIFLKWASHQGDVAPL